MKKGVGNFNSKNILLLVSSVFIFVVAVSMISATSTYACINCPDNQVLKATEKCGTFTGNGDAFEIQEKICMNGKYFQAGVYDWEIKKDNEVVSRGSKRVDNTGKFCLETKSEECGEYEMNFGGLKQTYSVKCEDIPQVPEFGTVIGIVTLLGALGVFFVIRRK